MPEKNIENKMFSFQTLEDKYNNGLLKDHLDAKQYILKYFAPLTNGQHVHFKTGSDDPETEFEYLSKETMNEVYLNRFENDIKLWYKKKTHPKRFICDISQDRIGDTFVNGSSKFFKPRKEFKSYSKATRSAVNKMIEFVKEVWTDNNDESLQYILKWFSNILKGNKNKTILYIKSQAQGVGKSTFTDFFVEFVIGKAFYAKGDKDSILTSFNMDLMGKPVVIFEELPVFNKGEWSACDGKLKDMATGDEMNYSDKYEKKIKTANINNYIILTNNKAIKRPDGRRYFMADINTKYKDNFEFFKKLREECFNNEVGEAFYNYLMEIDTSQFLSLQMPLTQGKKDAIVDLMSPLEKFLKFHYLLKKKEIKRTIKELYLEYSEFIKTKKEDQHIESPAEFRTEMKNLGFEFKPIGGYNSYRITVDQLEECAKKNNWRHELDNDMLKIHQETEEEDELLDYGVDKSDKSVHLSLDEQIKHYSNLLQSLYERKSMELESTYKKLKSTNSVVQKLYGFDKYFDKVLTKLNHEELNNDDNDEDVKTKRTEEEYATIAKDKITLDLTQIIF